MRIIELVGLPGCGKSTTINRALLNSPDKESYIFINPTFQNKIKLLLYAMISLIYNLPQVARYSSLILKLCNSIRTKRKSQILKIGMFEILQFSYILYVIKKMSEKTVVLSDQWVYQHIFSIAHDSNIRLYLDTIKEIDLLVCKMFGNKYEVIFCESPLETNVQRIIARQNGQSILDGLEEATLREIFACQKNNIELLKKTITVPFTLLNVDQELDNVVIDYKRLINTNKVL